MTVQISDEMVRAFRSAKRLYDCNCDFCETENVRAALSAALTEVAVLGMAEEVLHKRWPVLWENTRRVLADLGDAIEREAKD